MPSPSNKLERDRKGTRQTFRHQFERRIVLCEQTLYKEKVNICDSNYSLLQHNIYQHHHPQSDFTHLIDNVNIFLV